MLLKIMAEQQKKMTNRIVQMEKRVADQDKAIRVLLEAVRRLRKRKDSLVEFFRKSPLTGVDLDITRDRSHGREVQL